MQRVRIRYGKHGAARFVSARDLPSVWERARRRVDLPIAYSEGFHPHAKVSFPDALPVGYESTGEYAELTFAAPVDAASAMTAIAGTLPEGFEIISWREVAEGDLKLAKLLSSTLWEVVYPTSMGDADPSAEGAAALVGVLRTGIAAIVAADRVEVVRSHPDGDRTLDLRPALLAAAVADPSDEPPVAVVRALVRNDGPAVRPTDLHHALVAEAARTAAVLPDPTRFRRVVQGEPSPGGLREPLNGELFELEPNAHAAIAALRT